LAERIYRFVIQHASGKYLGEAGLRPLSMNEVYTFETSYEANAFMKNEVNSAVEYSVVRVKFELDTY